jgi:mono/diheme cytochrome c family protein
MAGIMLDFACGVVGLRGWKLALAVLATLAGLAAAGASVAAWLGDRKLRRSVAVRVVPVPFTNDPAALKAGSDLYEQRGCAQCHGADGTGRIVHDENGLFVRAPDITMHSGTAASTYSEGDWVRAIRHGVDQAGHALLFMPCEEYNQLTDTQLAALVAYVRGLPPAAGEGAIVRLPFHLRALYGMGLMQDATEKIDHRRPPVP